MAMADEPKKKRRRKKKSAPKQELPPPPPPKTVADSAAESAKRIFSKLGEGIKAAGQTAERYTRVGINSVEIEKIRLELKLAYSRLGQAVVKCWDEAPNIGITSSDTAIKKPLNEVKALRKKVRELEVRISELRKD
jgi:hypothetical protein